MQIHFFASLLFFQSFTACQQVQEMGQPQAVNLLSQPASACQKAPENTPPAATNLVFQSTDGGKTWQDASAGLPDDFQAHTMFTQNGEMLMGAESGLFRSTKPPVAEAWEKDFFSKGRITSIFPGRAGLYFCDYGTGIFQKAIGSGVYLPVFASLKDPTVHTLLETSDGSVLVGTDNGIFKSADGGKTWKTVFDEGMALSLVEADGALMAGNFRGLMRSTDGGEHWDWVLTEDGTAYRIGRIEGGLVAITHIGPETANSEDSGNWIRFSADSGKTWQRIGEGLSQGRFSYWMGENLGPIRLINDVVQLGKDLFCSTEAGIFRSADRGKTWKIVFHSPDKMSLRLHVSGQVIYVVTGAGC